MASSKVKNFIVNRSLFSSNKWNKEKIRYSFYFESNKRLYSTRDADCYDLVVVGGGIVGMAAAREISQRHKSLHIAVVEKENRVAYHQSGHNSGVIHAGIYYKPGTLKAKLCVEGMNLAYQYCDEKKIPYKKCGKLIVATNEIENKRLDDLFERGLKNNVKDLAIVDGKDISKIEPHCRGLKAIHSPHTGIVDWGKVTEFYAKDFTANGGRIYLDFEVKGFENANEKSDNSNDAHTVLILSPKKAIKSKYVLTCGGLHSDKLSEMSGCSPVPRIVPFRGEYLILKKDKSHLIRGNIYPVPDPAFPFLGVHFTPRMDGQVWLGPNAVLAFRREGYKWTDFNIPELWETVKFSGFRKLALKYLKYGSLEMLKSAFLRIQVKELQQFVPEVKLEDVMRGPTGVRAQALDASGDLVDDFVFDVGNDSIGKRILHCRNAPSPGATSSLAIAKLVADKVEQQFNLS